MPEDRSPSRPTPPRSAQPPRPPVPRSPGSAPTGSPQSAEQPARKVDLTVNKVIAGAGAAATSAVLGSFFGALGTVAGAAIGAIASTIATSLYEHSLNRTQDSVAALRSRRRASTAAAEVTVPIPRIPPAGTAQGDQPAQLLRPADPTTTGPGSSDAPTAAVGSGGGPTRRIGAGGTTSPKLPPRRPWGRWIAATAIVFVLGLMVVTGLELLKGSTLINGETGTSVGRVLERAPAEESPIPTPEPAATTKPSSTESAIPTAEPSATSRASRNAGPDRASSSAVPTTAAPPNR